MRKMVVLLIVLSLFTAGCALNIYKKNPKDVAEIEYLNREVERLKKLRANELREFDDIKRDLKKELKGKASVDIEERGLVITLANNILFDSGKAKLKENAYPVLDKIVVIIKEKASEKNIGIEGHTDNVPIKYSGWASNRELSTSRANNVYQYLVKKEGLNPAQLTTIGYGEFQPIAENKTAQGRAKNRRVEIVILPQYPKKSIEELESRNWVK